MLQDAAGGGEELERFLVHVVFCLVADDTGIFEPRDCFADLLEHRTRNGGTDLRRFLVFVLSGPQETGGQPLHSTGPRIGDIPVRLRRTL